MQDMEGHMGGWVRIMKIGNTFTGFKKRFVTDPWNPWSSVEINMDEPMIDFGLAVSSGSKDIVTTATIKDVSIAPLDTNSSRSAWTDFGYLFPDGYNPWNVAVRKPAKQSTTDYGGSASRAVDGNISPFWWSYSVTHTKVEVGPWWEVDLEELFNISEIKVYNRGDCCRWRLNDYTLEIFDGSEIVYSKRINHFNPTVQTIEVGKGIIGNKVRITSKLNNEPLSLAEVRVMSMGQSTTTSGGNDDGTESDS